METVFTALAAQRELRRESPADVPADKRAYPQWVGRIPQAIKEEVVTYCRANPISQSEFARRAIRLWLGVLDENDEENVRFERTYGYSVADPRPEKQRRHDRRGGLVQAGFLLTTEILAALARRSETDNDSQSRIVDAALEYALCLNAPTWDGEWVLFEDMVMARGA